MPRPIDANALYDMIHDNACHDVIGIADVLDFIEIAPTLDYAPVRHGEWMPLEEPQWNCFGLITIGYKCSECGREEPYNDQLYCRCGALMDGGELDG